MPSLLEKSLHQYAEECLVRGLTVHIPPSLSSYVDGDQGARHFVVTQEGQPGSVLVSASNWASLGSPAELSVPISPNLKVGSEIDLPYKIEGLSAPEAAAEAVALAVQFSTVQSEQGSHKVTPRPHSKSRAFHDPKTLLAALAAA